MNIWIMNHYATAMFFDKSGRHYWFANKLEKHGHKVTVFCANTFLNKNEKVNTKRKVLTVRRTGDTPFVFVRTIKSKGNGFYRILNMVSFYINLFPATNKYENKYGKPDVIIASSVHPLTMVAGIQIAKKRHIPCICEVRDLWPEAIFRFGKIKENSLVGRILIAGEHWIYKNADALIFTKEGDVEYLKEKKWTREQGGDVDLSKCHYINNGIDLRDYCERIKKDIYYDKDLEDVCFRVTYAGTIRTVNHVGNLLDAAKLIAEDSRYDDVKFLIFGEGANLPQLQKRVKKEKITNVKLKGYVEHKYIPYILSRSTVNLLNYSQAKYNWSRGSSSNKLFEYMASGRPVISTVHMGYSIIERYQCGTELKEDTPIDLATAIKEFHDMDKQNYLILCQNAKIGAKDFDFDVLTEKLIKVIEQVAGRQ